MPAEAPNPNQPVIDDSTGANINDDFIPSWVTDSKVGLFIVTINLTTWALNLASTYVGEPCSSITGQSVSLAALVVALLGVIVCGPLESLRRRARHFQDVQNRGVWAWILGRSWHPTPPEVQQRQVFNWYRAYLFTLWQVPSFARLFASSWEWLERTIVRCFRRKGAIALPNDVEADLLTKDVVANDYSSLYILYDVFVTLKWSVRVGQCVCIFVGLLCLPASGTANLVGHVLGLTQPVFGRIIAVIGSARARGGWSWSEVLVDLE